MVSHADELYCKGCGVQLQAVPVVQGGDVYCCEDCRDGYECSCAAEQEADEYLPDASESASTYAAYG